MLLVSILATPLVAVVVLIAFAVPQLVLDLTFSVVGFVVGFFYAARLYRSENNGRRGE